ncbi:Sodium/potassium-transporting ATPase subunit alpha-2 [Venturia inaequalis]|nr:Sodium/potassium-transporting ATPase subunit alpha-2 [Venturia inaequalis]
MLHPALLSLGVLSLAYLAQAVPQPSVTASFSSSEYTSKSTGIAIGIIVAIAVVVLCSVCGCCGMIWWFCARHRKNMRRIRAQNNMTPVVPPEQTQKIPPSVGGIQSNVISPPGHHPPGYFDQALGPPASHFDPKMSPQVPLTARITPMTPESQLQQQYHTGSRPPAPPHPQCVHEMPADPAPVAELKG